jgi:hypothetical protein
MFLCFCSTFNYYIIELVSNIVICYAMGELMSVINHRCVNKKKNLAFSIFFVIYHYTHYIFRYYFFLLIFFLFCTKSFSLKKKKLINSNKNFFLLGITICSASDIILLCLFDRVLDPFSK